MLGGADLEAVLADVVAAMDRRGYFPDGGVPVAVAQGSPAAMDSWLGTRKGYGAMKRAIQQLGRQTESPGSVAPVNSVTASSLAELGCPASTRKAANAHKRLRAWAGLDAQHPSQGPYEAGEAMGDVALGDILRLVLCIACARTEAAAEASGVWVKGPFRVGAPHRTSAAAALVDVDAHFKEHGCPRADFRAAMESRVQRRDSLFRDKVRRSVKTEKRSKFRAQKREMRRTRGGQFGREARAQRARVAEDEDSEAEEVIDGEEVA